jgi:hypothetical protein
MKPTHRAALDAFFYKVSASAIWECILPNRQQLLEQPALDVVQRLAIRRRLDDELLERLRTLRNSLNGLKSS